MQWMPLQNINTKRWALSVIHDDGATYDVTDVESDSVEKILCYIDYMNGRNTADIEPAILEKLMRLKEQYGE